jgi:hypothetical protein
MGCQPMWRHAHWIVHRKITGWQPVPLKPHTRFPGLIANIVFQKQPGAPCDCDGSVKNSTTTD